MLAIIGASGKLGYATLTALLDYNLIPRDQIIACTSSQQGSPTWTKLSSHGVVVRHADFNDSGSLRSSLAGADALYLVSTPRIELDFNNAAHGEGREAQHFSAIDAARAVGVKHIYYTSLAFGRPSVAGVMRAHIRTEEYLESLKDINWTIIREGLYNESWPLYLGYFDVSDDSRNSIKIAGDGRINWTAIQDLGLGSALVVTAPRQEYTGKILYLSTQANIMTLEEIAKLVGDARGTPVGVQIVSQQDHEEFYTKTKGMDAPAVEWWVSSYQAISNGETEVQDNTLDKLLEGQGVQATAMKDTISDMLSTK